MLLPLFGLVLSVSLFGAVGVLALWLLRIAQWRMPALFLFIVTAQLGMVAFAMLYGALFANAENQLESRTQVLGFLIGLPVSGSLVACMALRWAVSRPWWGRSRAAEA